MKLKKVVCCGLILMIFASSVSAAGKKTPFEKHGNLSIENGDLVDKNNNPVQLYGMSTHGIAWFPQYVNKEAFKSLRDEWNTNCIRLAMYTAEYNGYCTGGNQEYLKNLVFNGIDYATELGMYVIVDWHILNDKNPEVYREEAKKFFQEVSSKYKKNDNILYEICNEPNSGTSWSDILSYANYVIPEIRKNDKNAIVIVGTPDWCQKIDAVIPAPLDFDNVMYSVHFYANTHKEWLRSNLQKAYEQGLAIFVSEFGTCDASGNGGYNEYESRIWLQFLDEYNISYMNWSLANKNETASALNSSCRKNSKWVQTDLSESGKFIFNWYSKKEQ